MKPKKNVLVFLSIFIAAVFVLNLFGQQKGVLWDKIAELEAKIGILELGLGPPAYDSGWLDADWVLTINHNLGQDFGYTNIDNYVVNIQADNLNPPPNINNHGATWRFLTMNTIQVLPDWLPRKVRVRIWVY
jgi:hypothetical protein